jgi:hypothetical protein
VFAVDGAQNLRSEKEPGSGHRLDFDEESGFDELLHVQRSSPMGDPEQVRGSVDRHRRCLEQRVNQQRYQSGCTSRGDLGSVVLTELVQGDGPVHDVGRLMVEHAEEEPHPPEPVAMCAHRKQPGVVLITSGFEISRQIEQRSRQQSPLDQQQRHQEPTDPTVAIDKRMDGFELVVQTRDRDQRRQHMFRVQMTRPDRRALLRRICCCSICNCSRSR